MSQQKIKRHRKGGEPLTPREIEIRQAVEDELRQDLKKDVDRARADEPRAMECAVIFLRLPSGARRYVTSDVEYGDNAGLDFIEEIRDDIEGMGLLQAGETLEIGIVEIAATFFEATGADVIDEAIRRTQNVQ